MNINKETKLYGSFAHEAGNKGCEFFNAAFEKHKINAIYKSFSVEKIVDAFNAARTLKMAGFAVAMPFKIEMYNILGLINCRVSDCYGSVNTVISQTIKNGNGWVGYNTDFIGALEILKERAVNHDKLIIIGEGGLAKTVNGAWKEYRDTIFNATIINRNTAPILERISGALIYNCSPGDYSYLRHKNDFIDCRIGTPEGDKLYEIQSKAQFELYTGIKYE